MAERILGSGQCKQFLSMSFFNMVEIIKKILIILNSKWKNRKRDLKLNEDDEIMRERQNIIQYGEYELRLESTPASSQSSRAIKDEYKNKIRHIIKDCSNIFVREIGINIEWITSPKSRYETDKTYDIDNIIKPTLDAMSGKDGLFIDDCQVQNVMCYWIDKSSEDSPDELYIRVFALEQNNDYVFDKNSIVFFSIRRPNILFSAN